MAMHLVVFVSIYVCMWQKPFTIFVDDYVLENELWLASS